MITQTINRRSRWLAPVALLITTLTVAGLAPLAFGKIVRNTIDPEVVFSGNGRRLIVTVPVTVTPAGEKAFLQVTVTQRSTGAVAEGYAVITGTGEEQVWEIHAHAIGRPAFEEGPATAVGLARTTTRGKVTDAHQWLVDITLVAE